MITNYYEHDLLFQYKKTISSLKSWDSITVDKSTRKNQYFILSY